MGKGKSDASGIVKESLQDLNQVGVITVRGKDYFDSNTTHYSNNEPENRDAYTRNEIFTDRPIYRPGQTINFKVISFDYNQMGVPSIRPNSDLKFYLLMPMDKKIKNLTLLTNEVG